MSRFKKRGTATAFVVAAVVAFGALGVGNAVAAHSPHWVVNGSTFTGTETVSASNTTSFKLEVPTVANLECTTVTGSGNIHGEYLDESSGGISFSGCIVSSAPEVCTVQGVTHSDPVGTITTAPVSTELIAVSSTPYDVWTPTSGTEFVQIKLAGGECAASGTYEVKGNVAGKQVGTVPAVTIDQEFSKANSTAAGTELTFGGHKAFLSGTAGFTLTGANKGKTWEASL